MKVVSYNIRGLGSREKCREVRDVNLSFRADFCCIQESKKETVDDILCRTLWGSNNMGWAYRESIGRSGGIISIWNAGLFLVVS
ncbi:hypothetical protein ACS0TY_009854 [Phlomoides rotata]